MTPLDKTEKERLSTIKKFQYLSYSLIAGVVLALNAKDKIIATFSNFGASDYFLSLCQTLIISDIIILIIFWIIETAAEFQILQDYLAHAPVIKRQAYLSMIALSIVLGLLGYLYDQILIFSIIFATYNLVNMWAVWVFNQHFKECIEDSKVDPATTEKGLVLIAALEEYYFNRPHIPRIVTMMFFSMTCVSLSVAGILLESQNKNLFTYAAYLVMFINIAASEYTIWVWRQKRDIIIKPFNPNDVITKKHSS